MSSAFDRGLESGYANAAYEAAKLKTEVAQPVKPAHKRIVYMGGSTPRRINETLFQNKLTQAQDMF